MGKAVWIFPDQTEATIDDLQKMRTEAIDKWRKADKVEQRVLT